MSNDFTGLVAIVTGGASGLGAAIAQRLRAGGATVAVFDLRPDAAPHADLAVAGTLAPRTEVTARGTVAVSDLSMTGGDRPVIRVARIETAGLHYTWPSTLTVDRLHVRGSRLRAVRAERPR